MHSRALAAGLLAALLLSRPAAADEPAPWSLTILAVTDTRSEIPACDCVGIKFGGPALRSGVYKVARTWATPTVILDGGDFSASPGDTALEERDTLNRQVMGMLHYDAVGVGERDLALGAARLRLTALAVPLVCANLEGLPEIPPVRWVTAGNRKIAITAYLDPALAGTAPGGVPIGVTGDSIRVTDPGPALEKAIGTDARGADLVVLIAHAPWVAVPRLVASLDRVDVLVLGHPTDDTRVLEHVGEVPALAPPALGHELIQLTVTRAPDGELTDVRPRVWNLKNVRNGDPRIEKLTRAFEDGHPER
jgi:2',3'-cyclic-nucleotide 2'-phosphodiesterase (5'-nucleotidase family)